MKMLNGKVDFGLCFQLTMEVIRMLERMEMETMALVLIGLLITPFVIGSLWTLGMAIFWQLLWLGMKAGMFLFTICSVYMTYLRCRSRLSWKNIVKGTLLDLGGYRRGRKGRGGVLSEEDPEEVSKPQCTLLDAMLSVFFHSGLRVPPAVWDFGMDVILGKVERDDEDQQQDQDQSVAIMDRNHRQLRRNAILVKQEVSSSSSPQMLIEPGFRLTPLRTGSSNSLVPLAQESSDTDGSGSATQQDSDDMDIDASSPPPALVGYLENVYVYASPPTSVAAAVKANNRVGGRRKRGPRRKKAVESLREAAAAEGIRLNNYSPRE